MSKKGLSRREFLSNAAAAGFGALAASASRAWGLEAVSDPLSAYPDRGWEKAYRDLWNYDDKFTFLCAPNDTHNCLLHGYVRSGVLVRIGPTMRYGEAQDVEGRTMSHRWDPRCCQKGLALTRRFYGDRRVNQCMVRAGFMEWFKAGFPREANGLPPVQFFNRGRDEWIRVPHDEAAGIVAAALKNIAENYSGEEGQKRLLEQHYDEATVQATKGAGTQTLKLRGGMPLLGITRVFGMYRMANAIALLDAAIRKVGPDKALGARGFDNYSWHTDLPPGHPMVTGQQTVEFDLSAVEHAKTVVVWGMNWIATKMPDAHWLTEARMKGTRVVVIACEYSATASKGDDVVVVRPGTTPALALGFAHVLLKENLFDKEYVKRWTDLPLLVRMDNLKYLRAKDVFGSDLAALGNATQVLADGEAPSPPGAQKETQIPGKMRADWGDFVYWDQAAGAPKPITRDQVGALSAVADPLLEGRLDVTLADGSTVTCRPVFDLVKGYAAHFDPKTVEELTWAPAATVEALARHFAQAPGTTLFAIGMGPNQFFNNDNKDRAIFLLAALTGNVGRIGGNVGSYAGNYRTALFNGSGQYIAEDPFDIELDPAKKARPKQYWRAESAHYYNHEDHPLRVGNRLLTGSTHMPTPTKAMWFANANSILGNVKWHYNTVVNVLPRIEMIAVNEWWWSPSCEWADVVFGVDSWAELKYPDMTASVTNPFLQVFPRTPLSRIFNTLGDIEVLALVAGKLADLTGDTRFKDMFKFVTENRVEVYLQRILDNSTNTKGFKIEELEAKAREGIPAILNSRTSPKVVGYDQIEDSKPWYTMSGRLELYREEDEFIEAGENLPVHREPVDSTFYEPNVIVAPKHEVIRPAGPEIYGVERTDLSCETRCGRNVVLTWEETRATAHPRAAEGYRFIFHTPKYRHGAHTTPIDTDMVAILFGPFGDIYRRDKRKPFVTEGYVDINPDDARELGIEDGDYVWVDGDPEDRPFRGWQNNARDYEFSRLICRARYYPGTPRGVTRMWFNMYGATPGSVEGIKTRPDGLAKNPRTNYQAMFRSGSHQSATRGWLKPTWMTDSLVRKEMFGQTIGKGFLPDVHCPTGAPREAIVKFTKAEPGGMEGETLWRPAALGFRPRYETESMKAYLAGGFIRAGSDDGKKEL
ncbi:MAG TPA: molybdopterin-dependent oxidoreductase [Candidatus Hydrogenedentes bacterium]|nr:molybdopterin-dependent oxidoreductase [Candidatus Hydrogenedentota bacterium]HPC16077.1 molybdopterin-dependent oxidoreductase [Candidatus Hydrogenedentota bacterium]HRT18835.1 molybdopterin-dependent oxidoreductase [Candidatus Hydrogenedentota bacterium]HRT65560.1 molybdopterin-dependent oxidoreductase [Candidatus Hydrogenedentota bacterium]